MITPKDRGPLAQRAQLKSVGSERFRGQDLFYRDSTAVSREVRDRSRASQEHYSRAGNAQMTDVISVRSPQCMYKNDCTDAILAAWNRIQVGIACIPALNLINLWLVTNIRS